MSNTATAKPTPMASEVFDPAFANFLAKLQAKIDAMYAQDGGPCGVIFTAEVGQRYVRVVSNNTLNGVMGGGRSSYAFVDRVNGDVLKSESWKKPAKHARGSIFDSDPVAACQQHSVAYLR